MSNQWRSVEQRPPSARQHVDESVAPGKGSPFGPVRLPVDHRLTDVVLRRLLLLRFGFSSFQDLGEVPALEIVRVG